MYFSIEDQTAEREDLSAASVVKCPTLCDLFFHKSNNTFNYFLIIINK
jgi:hypothetical protein